MGTAIALSFGPHKDELREAGLDQGIAAIQERMIATSFVGFACVLIVLSAALWFAAASVDTRFDLPRHPRIRDYVDGNGVKVEAIGHIHRVLHGAVAGLLGALTMTLSKALGCLLGSSVGSTVAGGGGAGAAALASPVTYLVALGVLGSLCFQAHALNTGVARFPLSWVLPVYQVVWTAAAAIGGLTVWGEWSALESQSQMPAGAPPVAFVLGLLLSLAGVGVVSAAGHDPERAHHRPEPAAYVYASEIRDRVGDEGGIRPRGNRWVQGAAGAGPWQGAIRSFRRFVGFGREPAFSR